MLPDDKNHARFWIEAWPDCESGKLSSKQRRERKHERRSDARRRGEFHVSVADRIYGFSMTSSSQKRPHGCNQNFLRDVHVFCVHCLCVFFVSRSSFLTFTLHLLLEQNFQSRNAFIPCTPSLFPTLSFQLWTELPFWAKRENRDVISSTDFEITVFLPPEPALCAGKRMQLSERWKEEKKVACNCSISLLPPLSSCYCRWFDQVINGGKVVKEVEGSRQKKRRGKVSVSSR